MSRTQVAINVGVFCMVGAVGAFDWRLGLLLFGSLLTLAAWMAENHVRKSARNR